MSPYIGEMIKALQRNAACAKGFSEMLQLIGEIINHNASNVLEFNPDAVKAYLDFVNAVLPDGNYEQSWYLVIFNYI